MKKKYLWLSVFILGVLSVIYIIKGIFPFGNESVIWSDMHEQITAIYYHFYDAIRGNSSLLVDFTSGGGVNFVGILAYYILSPFTLILLLFPRDLVENAVSIVVALKILASGITCLYFLSKTFKKVNSSYQVLLSILYAFSSYTLALYIITPWMDLVYLFPLLMFGLRKLLDLEDTKVYIIVLSICLICSFYVSFMILLFIIITSLIYLLIYNKNNRKKAIFNLGVSTVISLLISSIVLIPSFIQIFSSQRAGFDLNVILNSKFGPLSDKISFLFGSTILLAFVLLLFFNYKKHKKFSLFLLLNLFILMLPLIIEPLNKMWHFGSYVYFCYRYGFILIFMLVVGAAYYLNNIDVKKVYSFKIKRILPISLFAFSLLIMIFIFIKFRINILEAIDQLTLTRDKKALFSLFIVSLFVFIVTFSLIFTNKKNERFTIYFVYSLSIVQILFNCYFYFNREDSIILAKQYDWMLAMNNVDELKSNYYIKEINRDLISNYGMVSGTKTFSNFTSLTDKTNFFTMQRLGYDSYWMDTESIGGNLFTDIVLAQKYIISKANFNDSYYSYVNNISGLNYYKFNSNMSYGYFIKENNSLINSKNSYDASNIIYKSITGNDNLFDIYDLFVNKNNKINFYEKGILIDKDIEIKGRRRLYLEIFTDYDSYVKNNNYNGFDIYINDKIFTKNYPNDDRNGSIFLGEYSNNTVNIKIVSVKNTKVRNITIGSLDLDKLDNFINNNYINNLSVNFNRNSIDVNVDGKKGDILFLPITYLDGYKSNTHEIFRVFDNFVGIRLKNGSNSIEITYTPKGIILGSILSLIGILIFIVWEKYLNKLNFNILYTLFYFIYLIIYIFLVFIFYILMPLFFIKSFF